MARRASHEPHEILRVRRGASRGEISRAYRARARQIHPDVSGADTTTDMAELSAARDALLSRTPPEGASLRGEQPRRRPKWPAAHEPWTDYWAAWNEPRRRGP